MIKRNNEWYLGLVEKIGTKMLTNREFYALMDQYDTEKGIEVSAFAHHQVLTRLESTGGVDIIADDTRKGHGREKPTILSISNMDKVISAFSKSTTTPSAKTKAEKAVKKVERKAAVVPRMELVDRVYSILLQAKNDGMLSLSKMAKCIGISSLCGSQFNGWLNTLEKFGVKISCARYGDGWKFDNIPASIIDLGKAGNKWFGSDRYPWRKDSGIGNAKPVEIKEHHIPVSKTIGDLSPMEHDILYLAAGMIRAEGKDKCYDLTDLNATINKILRIRLLKNDFLSLLKLDENFYVDQMAFAKVRLKDGDKSWKAVKAAHGPETQPKKKIILRLKMSEEYLKTFGFSEVSVRSRYSDSDNIYQIMITPNSMEYSKLRKLISTMRFGDGEDVFTEDELIQGLIRDVKVMNSSWDRSSPRYIIDSEEWEIKEAERDR